MDGTVLNDEKKILKETKEALEQAARAGIEIVPATGRPFCGISDEIYRLDGVRYVLTTNGAGIYERDSKTCLYEDAIPLSAYLPMLAEVEAYDVMADTFLKGGALMTKRKRDLLPRMRLTKEIRDYILSSRQVVESQVDYLRERGTCVHRAARERRPGTQSADGGHDAPARGMRDAGHKGRAVATPRAALLPAHPSD